MCSSADRVAGKGIKSLKKSVNLFLVILLIVGLPLSTSQTHLEASASVAERVEISSHQKSVDPNASYAALRNNLAVLGADMVMTGSGVTGTGQIVGIVDTGVDPFMPGFTRADGTLKVKNWIDVTKEGKATILGKYKSRNGIISANNVDLKVDSLKSLGGTYIVGMLPSIISEQVPSNPDMYFVVYDPVKEGVFEAIAVDTNMNLDFRDEVTFYEYNTSKCGVKIQVDSRKAISLVATSIGRRGDEVIFGFDLHGHGTGMASIISGYDREQGGVAPDAELVVAKAISSTGFGSWDNIVRGIEYCLNNGASVVLVGAVSENPVSEPLWASVEKLAQSKNAHIVMAAGNKGPGVGTLTIGSSWPGLIVSSGYYPTGTFNALFGWKLSRDTFYPYSSCGPDLEGNRGIDVMAPAIAPVPEPGYHKTLQFALMDGTSVSAAYAAGAVALLRQGSIRFGLKPLEGATLSLLEGANPLKGILPVEQGYGKINMVKAWSLIVKGISDSRLKLVRKWMGTVTDGDVWIKGNRLGALPLWVDNFAPGLRHVEIEATEPWLKSQSIYLDIMPVAQRATVIYGSGELPPGFHSGEILADDLGTPGVDGRMAVNISMPHEFSEEGNVAFPVTLETGSYLSRHFLRIPESAQGISLSMESLGSGVRFMLYNPDGLLVEQGWIEDLEVCRVGLPKAGLWQICFFRDPQDGVEGRTALAVNASLEGVCITDLGTFGGVQEFIAKSDEALPVTLSFIGSNSKVEWRDRSSVMIPTRQATFLPLLEVSEDVESICIRFGTNRTGSLRGYLYYLDGTSGKWVEIENSLTDASCIGQICINEPANGRYLACIEGYSRGGASCYAEIDYLVVKNGQVSGVPVAGKVNLLNQGTTSFQVEAAQTPNSPGVMIIRKGVKGNILGVIERAGAFQPALVQLSGTGTLRTIRAISEDGLAPVDAYVTMGDAAYQLYRGKITVPLPSVQHGEYQVPENKGIFRFGM